MDRRLDEGLTQAELDQLNQLKARLGALNVSFRILSHAQAVLTLKEGVEQALGKLGEMAPTLILETEKGFLAAVIGGDSRLSYRKIRKELGLKNVRLATAEAVLRETGVEVGIVSMVNSSIRTIVDSRLRGLKSLLGGCGVRYHTLSISPAELIRATQAEVFDFSESKT